MGAARLLSGMARAVDPEAITAIVNVGDDTQLHGLHISPDIDTIIYTLAGAIDPERGWGLVDETWNAMEQFGRYGNPTWFNLGDRDLATHIVRTERLRNGDPLSTVTRHLADSWGLGCRIIPVTDDALRTIVTIDEGDISFQEYFVGRRHDVAVNEIRFEGAADAAPAPGVIAALHDADRVVIAPSNPIVSIDPLLAVAGVRERIIDRRADTVAVSPIVGGQAIKGPAARLLVELGHEASVVGVARLYAPLAATLVIDDVDAASAPAVEDEGMRCVVTDTIMNDPTRAESLARAVLA